MEPNHPQQMRYETPVVYLFINPSQPSQDNVLYYLYGAVRELIRKYFVGLFVKKK